MTDFNGKPTRRAAIKAGAAMIGGGALAWTLPGSARAEDYPALGTYPAGSAGDSVFIGIEVPRTGTYAVQGEDLLKGYQLAIEHLNNGDELIRKISPKTTKGVLGKTVKFGVADEEAKPNTAVQVGSRFISENKAMMITGSVSSAVAVALNKLADREKVIYLPGHKRLQRHHRQGLRPLFVPQLLLRPDGRGGTRPGAGQEHRQQQEDRLS